MPATVAPHPNHDVGDHPAVGHRCAGDVGLLRRIADRLLTDPADRERFFRSNAQYHESGVTDYFFATEGQKCDPDRLFEVLRWGGQLIYSSSDRRRVGSLLDAYRRRPEFTVDAEPQAIESPRTLRLGPFDTRIRLMPRRHHFFVVRKTLITRPGDATDRYSYDVRLQRNGSSNHYVVLKQVPTFEHACQRLAARFPDQPAETIEKGARKLVDKVFPVFLTREAALLKIIERALPESYRCRFPSVIDIEQDDRGLVRRMSMNWLRLGGNPIPQAEFARQATELLHVLHDAVGVIHLDLRLDNMVVTPRGVGFVDFGSAARIGESFEGNPMLSTLFSELLSTSQIQRDLRRLIRKGKVTSRLFTDCAAKIDKAADLFYLVLQMNNPHANPEFRGLVRYERESDEARALARLSRGVLSPKDPSRSPYHSACDVMRGIERVQSKLAG